jgi:cell wall-associated NlpC family hydrolase
MPTNLTRRQALAALAATAAAPLLPRTISAREADGPAYTSPYHLAFTFERDNLVGDLEHTERGNPRRESSTPHEHWYSHETRRRFGAWGPEQRHYEPLPGLAERQLNWKQERVIAVGARFIGYEYQHHHVPDWDPPQHWPWKHCCAGHNGRGVDCSNFTTFVYNHGFGIHMSSGIGEQAKLHTALIGSHEHHAVHRIELPAGYEERQKTLHTGDLLYIRGREEGPISHVVMWVGPIGRTLGGRSPSNVPLIMDSHGDNVVDDDGHHIPCGIHLRPFRADSWYNRCASHAHRIFTG